MYTKSISLHKLMRVFTGLLILLTYVSSNAVGTEKIVWQGGYDYVAIVPTDKANRLPNNHPVQISPRDIYTLLSSIRLSKDEGGFFNTDFFDSNSDDENSEYDSETRSRHPQNKFFSTSELRKISGPISKALAKLQPGEDITFSVSGQHELYFGKNIRSSTARIFYLDNKLHIIFGTTYADISKKYFRAGGTTNVAGQAETNDLKRFRLKVGSRSDKSRLKTKFMTDDFHQLYIQNNKKRHDWLVIDTPRFMDSIEKNKISEKQTPRTTGEARELQSQTQKIDQEQQLLNKKIERLEREMQAREKNSQNENSNSYSRRVKPTATLEERLSTLKELHKKGMVSDKAYNEKVRLLLKEL